MLHLCVNTKYVQCTWGGQRGFHIPQDEHYSSELSYGCWGSINAGSLESS